MDLKTAVKAWLTYLRGNNASAHTRYNYGRDMERFVTFFNEGVVDVKNIAFDPVMEFLKEFRDKGHSRATTNRMKSCLTNFFNYLRDAGHIEDLPFRKLKHEKVVRSDPQPLYEADRVKLDKVVSARKDVDLLVALYLDRGLRESEAIWLNVDDVEDQDRLRIVGKREKVRRILVGEKLKIKIKAWLEDRYRLLQKLLKKKSGKHRATVINRKALFITRQGRRLSSRGARWILRQCFEKAELDWMTVHKLRHSCAHRLANELNIPLPIVKELLGHQDIGTTQIYARATRADVDEALLKADRKVTPI